MARNVIEVAIDLARMPGLARASVVPPIPPNVVELMRIAAGSSADCEAAAVATGEPVEVVMDAARFYLQQALFRADADCFRVLGIQPGTDRAVARDHMRWLLQWLHPDRNSDLESVYAERVLKAWREFSAAGSSGALNTRLPAVKRRRAKAVRVPWIKQPPQNDASFRKWAAVLGVILILAAAGSVIYVLGSDETIAQNNTR